MIGWLIRQVRIIPEMGIWKIRLFSNMACLIGKWLGKMADESSPCHALDGLLEISPLS